MILPSTAPTLDPPEGTPLASVVEPGFTVSIDRVGLAEAIQLSSQTLRTRSLRIRSGRREGWLFFKDGELVHATIEGQMGLNALVLMLGMSQGTVESVAPPPGPFQRTLTHPVDALLLFAAQRIDEGRLAPEAAAAPPPADSQQTASPRECTRVVRCLDATTSDDEDCSPDLKRLDVVMLAAEGSVRSQRGSATPTLADIAFYTQRLASAIGDELGLGACEALCIEGPSQGVVVFRGKSTVGVFGDSADLAFVKQRVGLV